ncbi:hypothetical protein DSL72_006990 [Monilinia vaccinii-corymbosi]|uniref:RING-type domain-containing protein n=1 Tax=Monilinia vaccinii-corymbosi TaxID=61207 RepID=A0A8A3PKK7_9HELO|nr:hypothetical protein DSL72_006990 [Monilinia vaccinii-corymbosi]
MAAMNPDSCKVAETFSTVCGHVASIVKHGDRCPHPQDPQYCPEDKRSGQFIHMDDHFLRSVRWVSAKITESKCIYCEAVEQGTPFVAPPMTWISDVGDSEGEHKIVSPAEIASRREFWKNFIADHAVLSQRQHDLLEVYRAAATELQQYDARSGNEETVIKIATAAIISKKMYEWYDLERYLYLGMVRMMGEMEMALLFDPNKLTLLTYELLYPVNPDEIPSGEVCGICMDELNSAEPSDNVRRVFCGRHLFHQECIVQWFEKSRELKASCPMCRKTHQFYRAPFREWLPIHSQQGPFGRTFDDTLNGESELSDVESELSDVESELSDVESELADVDDDDAEAEDPA